MTLSSTVHVQTAHYSAYVSVEGSKSCRIIWYIFAFKFLLLTDIVLLSACCILVIICTYVTSRSPLLNLVRWRFWGFCPQRQLVWGINMKFGTIEATFEALNFNHLVSRYQQNSQFISHLILVMYIYKNILNSFCWTTINGQICETVNGSKTAQHWSFCANGNAK